MRTLAIETSCDETSIAVLETTRDGSFNLLTNIVSSQVKIHAPFGGVVPMLAKREHQKNLVPLLKQALKEANLLISQIISICEIDKLRLILSREPELLKKLLPFLKKYAKPDIDLITVTNGPGLEPALWVGVNFAKALGYFWNLPVIPINHIEAHIVANWLDIANRKPLTANRSGNKRSAVNGKQFPILCLVVSGGHTQLVLMKKFGDYKILGETRDDAAGEAFDKLAKMLNLGYPGGPIVAQIAHEYCHSEPPAGGDESPANAGDKVPHTREILRSAQNDKIKLPRPMLNSPDYDFSFSGLKTAALYFVKTLDKKTLKKLTPAICAEFQQSVVDVLVSKTIRAAKEFNVKTIMLGGGVAANDLLRDSLSHATCDLSLNFSLPAKSFCGDNAAMIALTALLKTRDLKIKSYNWQKIQVNSNLRL